MEPDLTIYPVLRAIRWFEQCGGEGRDEYEFRVERVPTLALAIEGRQSDLWDDVRNEAGGDLTAYLAVHHPDAYGSHWNPLADVTMQKLDDEIMADVNAALERLGALGLSKGVRYDLGMIALYSAYHRKFKRIPDFFAKMLVVYQSGRLPCGWSEPFEAWPKGHLVVY